MDQPPQHTGVLRILERHTYRAALLLTLASALYAGFYSFWYWHARLIPAGHPQDYRETATYFTTVLLLRGENPWSVENQPQFANVYGVLYNLLAVLPAGLFGCSLPLHRVLSAVLLLLCCVVIVLALRRYRTPWALALIAPVILYQQYMPTYASNAKPDNLGLLLFLAAVLVPWHWRFSTRSLIVSGALAVLALYAKFYFAIAFAYVGLYMFLFQNRRTALIYIGGTLLAIWVSALLVGLVLPLYWTNTFFGQWNDSFLEWDYLVAQLAWYTRINFGVLALLGLGVIVWAVRACRVPRAKEPPDYVSFLLLLSTVLILARIGWRSGNFGVYFHQLITPFLLIVALRRIPTAHLPRALLVALPCAQLVYSYTLTRPLRTDLARDYAVWAAAVDQYEGEVFAAPVFAQLLMERGQAIYNDGQTDYVPMGLAHNVSRVKRRVRARLAEYDRDLQTKLATRTFSAVIEWHGWYSLGITPERLTPTYALVAQRPWRVALNRGVCDIWVPRPATSADPDTFPRAGLVFDLSADHAVDVDTGSPGVMRFDGVDDTLRIHTPPLGQSDFTFVLALKPADRPEHGQTVQAPSGWERFAFQCDARGGIYIGRGRATRITPRDGPGPDTLVVGTWHVFEYVEHNGEARFYKNGALLACKAAGPAVAWSGLQLGATEADGALAGDIGTVLLYDRALSNRERRALERMLLERYQIVRPLDAGP